MNGLAGNALERISKRLGWGIYPSHIGPNGSYMRRWILRTPFGMLRLHNILRSDNDRHLHDHPFDFTSFLLTGGYEETTPDKWSEGAVTTHYWPRFSVVRKKAEDLHKLTLEKPVWTLVLSGPIRREWGFQTERGWMHHDNYPGEWEKRTSVPSRVRMLCDECWGQNPTCVVCHGAQYLEKDPYNESTSGEQR